MTDSRDADSGNVETVAVSEAERGAAALAAQIPADRFEVLADPLGWRCRSCRAEVFGGGSASAESTPNAMVARLAESAADHAMYCGRCDD